MINIFTLALLYTCVALTQCMSGHEVRKFPDGFVFGAATASYQIEGGWNVDGKTKNIWDHITRMQPDFVKDHSNGDVACNSYYLYKRDIQMLRELGLDFYRFSLSWTRIFPNGFADKINKPGVQYYNNLIDELLKYNIQPVVTLYHWDLPQKLQDLGGWANPDVVTWYADYARTAFTLFGDRVKLFVTINEPHQVCYYGYSVGLLAPGLKIGGIAEYMCAKNLLVAHAVAYRIYDQEFRSWQGGKVFISLSAQWYEPASNRDADIRAARYANQFNWAKYSWPIYSETGDFPPEMKSRIAEKSTEQGFPRSRLPKFTPEEIIFIKGSSDYFGLNHYVAYYTYRNESVELSGYAKPSFEDDLGVSTYQLQEWKIGASNFSQYVPWGFTKLLKCIKDDYNNPPVFITENGFATHGGLVDEDRVQYYRGYLGAVLDAIDDGCDVRAYTAWSLMDNFEWANGYTENFGLYEVDFSDMNRTRTPRKSAYMYKELVRTHKLDPLYEPDLSRAITIDDER